jgi:transcriptional regulator with XRE-family HTH domain
MTKLANIIQARGLTQYRVAKDLGIPCKSLNNWCLGKRKLSDYKIIIKLTEYLVCKPEDILER